MFFVRVLSSDYTSLSVTGTGTMTTNITSRSLPGTPMNFGCSK